MRLFVVQPDSARPARARSLSLSAMAGITCVRHVSVQGGMLQHPWIIKHVETIEGEDFMKLDKSDSGLSRFVFGSYKASAGRLYKCAFFETLRNSRSSFLKAKAGGKLDGSCTVWKWKRAKKRSQIETVDKTLTMELPPVSYGDEAVPSTGLVLKMPQHMNEAMVGEIDKHGWGGGGCGEGGVMHAGGCTSA